MFLTNSKGSKTMRKSIIALTAASIFSLTGCDFLENTASTDKTAIETALTQEQQKHLKVIQEAHVKLQEHKAAIAAAIAAAKAADADADAKEADLAALKGKSLNMILGEELNEKLKAALNSEFVKEVTKYSKFYQAPENFQVVEYSYLDTIVTNDTIVYIENLNNLCTKHARVELVIKKAGANKDLVKALRVQDDSAKTTEEAKTAIKTELNSLIKAEKLSEAALLLSSANKVLVAAGSGKIDGFAGVEVVAKLLEKEENKELFNKLTKESQFNLIEKTTAEVKQQATITAEATTAGKFFANTAQLHKNYNDLVTKLGGTNATAITDLTVTKDGTDAAHTGSFKQLAEFNTGDSKYAEKVAANGDAVLFADKWNTAVKADSAAGSIMKDISALNTAVGELETNIVTATAEEGALKPIFNTVTKRTDNTAIEKLKYVDSINLNKETITAIAGLDTSTFNTAGLLAVANAIEKRFKDAEDALVTMNTIASNSDKAKLLSTTTTTEYTSFVEAYETIAKFTGVANTINIADKLKLEIEAINAQAAPTQ